MHKLLKTGFSLVSLVVLVQIVSVTAAKADVVSEILKRMEAHYQALSTLRANIKMAQFISQTGENEVREGKLVYVPGKGRSAAFRLDWVQPVESLSVLDGKYRMYRENLKVAYVGSASGAGLPTNSVLSLLSLSKAELKAAFEINYAGEEKVSGGVSTWHLQLVPRSGVTYKNADIWVDKDGMVIQVRQSEKNGDVTTILLSNLSKNSKVNLADIPVSFPKGVDIKRT